jgi:hypothetical protein
MVDHYIQALLEAPIGSRDFRMDGDGHVRDPQALEAARRAQKIWLPEGKKKISAKDAKAAKDQFFAGQCDLEDAIEAAGGNRGKAA